MLCSCCRHFDTAVELLQDITDASYIASFHAKSVSQLSSVGTPNEKALVQEMLRCGTHATDVAVADAAASPPVARRAPKRRGIKGVGRGAATSDLRRQVMATSSVASAQAAFPDLAGQLSATLALRTWASCHAGTPPTHMLWLEEIKRYGAHGHHAAITHFYVGQALSMLQADLGVFCPPKSTIETTTETTATTPPCTAGETSAAPAATASPINARAMKVVELKAALQLRGLPTSGRKAELLARLEEALNCAQSCEEAPESEEIPGPTTVLTTDAAIDGASSAWEHPDWHYHRALDACRRFPRPELLRKVCYRLATRAATAPHPTPMQSAFYLHLGLGARTRQEIGRRLVKTTHPSTTDATPAAATADATPTTASIDESATAQYALLKEAQNGMDFQSNYVDHFPPGLTVFGLSVNDDGTMALASRLMCKQPSVVFSLSTAPKTPAAARSGGLLAAPTIASVRATIDDVIRKSDDVIASGGDILAVADEHDKEVRMLAWWEARESLDRQLETALTTLENDVFGWKKVR